MLQAYREPVRCGGSAKCEIGCKRFGSDFLVVLRGDGGPGKPNKHWGEVGGVVCILE